MTEDILAIKRKLVDRVKDVAPKLLPGGVREGREWAAGSIGGEAGHSLKVCLEGEKRGTWADFASDGESGDLIDLWCAVRRQRLPEALDDIRAYLGISSPTFESKAEKHWKRPAKPRSTKPTSAVREWLMQTRKISATAIDAYRVLERGRIMDFPYFLPDGSMPFAKFRHIDPDEQGRKIIKPVDSGMEPVLFGWQAVNVDSRECVLVEGELDSLAMFDYGFPALSVPFGGGGGAKQSWIESEFGRMSKFEIIYLALDMDEEGETACKAISERLGAHRCRRVKLPRKDANQCLMEGVSTEEILKCVMSAKGLDPAELKRAGEFTDQVVGLFWPKSDEPVGYRMPFDRLGSKLLFRPAEITIWTGATGAGKSQLLSHAAVDWIEQGARICVASLEMAPRQLLKRMVKQAGNIDRPSEPYIRACMDWISDGTWLFAVTGKSPIKRILEIFEYARARYGCDVFVIDSLMRLGVGVDDYKAQDAAMFEIVNWGTSKGVHVHLVAHARKAGKDNTGAAGSEDVKGTSEIASNAFNVVSVKRIEKIEDEVRKAKEGVDRGDQSCVAVLAGLEDKPTVIMNVAKQRNGDFEGKVGLWFNVESYQYRSFGDPKQGKRYVRFYDAPHHQHDEPDDGPARFLAAG